MTGVTAEESPTTAWAATSAARCGFCYDRSVTDTPSFLSDWTPEQLAAGRQWVRTWRQAGIDLERVRRDELRRLDGPRAIALLCGPADYTVPPRAPKPTSGLVEQQRWFQKSRRP